MKNFLVIVTDYLRKKEFIILFFVLAVTALSFYSSLSGEFTNWDDRMHIVDNPEISKLDWDHIKTIFTSTASRGYIPLTIFSYAIEYHFAGLNPFVFHLDNLLLHLLVTALIFFFGLRLKLDVWACGLAALLFGIHPMHVESVAWISQRKDVLYAVFYLLAMHSYWTYLETGKKTSYGVAIVYGFLSMLAKPMALSLPLILLLLDGMKGRKLTPKIFLEKIPYFFYIIPITLLTYQIHAHAIQTPPMEAGLIWVWTMMFYIEKFIFSFQFCPMYSLPEPIGFLNPSYMRAVLEVILFVLIVIRFRSHRWILFASCFYILSMFVLFRLDASQLSVVADRYMYLPSVGFCFLFGWLIHQGLTRLRHKKALLATAILCLFIVFGILSIKTFSQCKVWKDSLTLWSEMIRYNPNYSAAFYNRGRAYEFAGRPDLAVVDYGKAIEIKPDFAMALNNRGAIFLHQGRESSALRDFNQVILIDPEFAEVYSNRALVYFHRKQYEPALIDLKKALELNPDFVSAHGNQGLVYAEMKQYNLALESYNQGLKLDPSHASLYYYRSLMYANLQEFDAAMADAQKARTLGYPNMDEYINQLRKAL